MTNSVNGITKRLQELQDDLANLKEKRMLDYIKDKHSSTIGNQVSEPVLFEFVSFYNTNAKLYPSLSKLDPNSEKDMVHFLVHEAAAAVSMDVRPEASDELADKNNERSPSLTRSST